MAEENNGTTYERIIPEEVDAAVETLQDSLVDIREMQEMLGIGSYQYARTLVIEDRYGLGTNSIELFGRTLVLRQAVENAKAERESAAAAREARAAERAQKKTAAKAEPKEDIGLDDLLDG